MSSPLRESKLAALDSPSLTISLAMIAGVIAQGIAIHLRIPGIVLLLMVGVVLGPDVANLVRPDAMGASLPAFVGFAVAIVLFEGGLSMNLKRLSRQAVAIRRLVTVGALVTAIGATLAARLIMPDWDWRLAILFGTLVIVTGPTVITPLVRRLRIKPTVGTILEAEGIFIDAVGATIAVVALDAALAWSSESAAGAVVDVVWRIGVGAVIGLMGGGLLALLVRWRRVVPEGLETILALATAVATFQISNSVVHESGISAAIVAGMVLSNTSSHAFDEIVEFKERLTVFFIATLFVLLAAHVRVDDVVDLGVPGLMTVVALMFVVRPLTVVVSTWNTGLGWREKLFLSWLAPRGIVAAAVASLFAMELDAVGIGGGTEMQAMVFLVILMTVSVQGLTGGPLASLLGLRRASNDGYLFLGAGDLARVVASALQRGGEPVVLIDANSEICQAAEKDGLDLICGNGLEESAMIRGQIDTRKGCVALTPNETVNFLFTRRVRDAFKGVTAYVGLESTMDGVTAKMVDNLHAQLLFGNEVPLEMWNHLIRDRDVSTETWTLDFPVGESVDFSTLPTNALLPIVAWTSGRPILVDHEGRVKKDDRLEVLVRKTKRTEAHEWLRNAGFVPTSDSQVAVLPIKPD